MKRVLHWLKIISDWETCKLVSLFCFVDQKKQQRMSLQRKLSTIVQKIQNTASPQSPSKHTLIQDEDNDQLHLTKNDDDSFFEQENITTSSSSTPSTPTSSKKSTVFQEAAKGCMRVCTKYCTFIFSRARHWVQLLV